MRQHLRKSVNVLICLSLLLGSLGPGDPGPGTSALAAPADDSSDGVPSSALPIGNWPDLVAAAPAASSTITLAASGFTPAVITVSMGSEVAWYNATGQTHVVKSGVPYRAYLPLVVRGASSSAAAERTAQASGGRVAVSGGEAFTGTIPPGGTFTHTFASAGQFPYFAATAPAFQGRVIVQSSGLPPDPGHRRAAGGSQRAHGHRLRHRVSLHGRRTHPDRRPPRDHRDHARGGAARPGPEQRGHAHLRDASRPS